MRPPFTYVRWPHRPRVIGPRFIPYLDADGDRCEASVRIRMGAREFWTFAHVEGYEHVELDDHLLGRFWVEIDGHRWAKTFPGTDDIHLLRLCLWFAGDWLIRTAQEAGLTLLPDSETPVTTWPQLFAARP
ncbi:hypothetical protein ACN2C6_11780 [Caulobacter sp. ErkDOM-YI]|uniref:hypothetical protein n=1 Tax=unclassified Caulobacter TaxID=2648921 RepID=UPI003AF8A69B